MRAEAGGEMLVGRKCTGRVREGRQEAQLILVPSPPPHPGCSLLLPKPWLVDQLKELSSWGTWPELVEKGPLLPLLLPATLNLDRECGRAPMPESSASHN